MSECLFRVVGISSGPAEHIMRFMEPTNPLSSLAILMEDPGKRHWPGKSSRQCQLLLAVLITSCLAFKATDSRDKVFGVVGMIQNRPGSDLHVGSAGNTWSLDIDYSQSTAKVFADMTVKVIRDTRRLGVLEMHRPCPGLPSWVLDWDKPDDLKPPNGMGDV